MKSRRGFTLIELMVAITIILLLVAAASISISNSLRSERDGNRITDILTIGKAMDQAIQNNRGIVPHKAGTSTADPTYRFCPVDLVGAVNYANLDLSLFSGKAIPTDPSPGKPPASPPNCSSYVYGYVIHTQYYLPSAKPSPYTSACPLSQMATCQQVLYSLEVGLENPHPDIALKSYIDLGLTPTSVYNPSSPVAPDSTNPRTPFFLNGQYCGAGASGTATCYGP